MTPKCLRSGQSAVFCSVCRYRYCDWGILLSAKANRPGCGLSERGIRSDPRPPLAPTQNSLRPSTLRYAPTCVGARERRLTAHAGSEERISFKKAQVYYAPKSKTRKDDVISVQGL
eukprot:2663088-Rhodomonas_salina.10